MRLNCLGLFLRLRRLLVSTSNDFGQFRSWIQVMIRFYLMCLCLIANSVALAQSHLDISSIVSSPSDPQKFFTVDGFGSAQQWTRGNAKSDWLNSFRNSKHEGGFAADFSPRYGILAVCSRRPIEGYIELRLIDVRNGQLLKSARINQNSSSKLLASCNHLRFAGDENFLLFNDVDKVHRFSLRLNKLTHTYHGGDRHQASQVSQDGKRIWGLSDKVLSWDLRSGVLLRRHRIFLPGFSQYGEWDVAAEISPGSELGFVIASDSQNRTALLWVQMSTGQIKRNFPIAESAAIAKIKFIGLDTVVALVNQSVYLWNYSENGPREQGLNDFHGLEQKWEGHEDVAINEVIRGTPPQEIPKPPYPPEYTETMSPDAFPGEFSSDGRFFIANYCCSGAMGIHWIPTQILE